MTPSGSSTAISGRERRSGGSGDGSWSIRPWAPGRVACVGICRSFSGRIPSIKDHLALFTHGVVGQWSLPKKTGRDYVEQMTAEVREEREDSRGRIKVLWVQKRRDNHYLDCELMIDVAAIVSGHLKSARHAEAGDEIHSRQVELAMADS